MRENTSNRKKFIKRIAEEIARYVDRYECDVRDLWDELYEAVEAKVT